MPTVRLVAGPRRARRAARVHRPRPPDPVIGVEFGRDARDLLTAGADVTYDESDAAHHVDPRSIAELPGWVERALAEPRLSRQSIQRAAGHLVRLGDAEQLEAVGATSARMPPSRSSSPSTVTISGTGFSECAVFGRAVRLEHVVGVAVVGGDQAGAARAAAPPRPPRRGTRRPSRPP